MAVVALNLRHGSNEFYVQFKSWKHVLPYFEDQECRHERFFNECMQCNLVFNAQSSGLKMQHFLTKISSYR